MGHEHNHSEIDESSEDQEIRSWKVKLWLAWLLVIPITVLMLLERIFGIAFFEMEVTTIILLVLAFPVVFILGFSTLRSGFRGLFTFYFNMDSLISLGTVIAYITGFLSLTGIMQDYSGVAAMIMAFVITGKYVETKARGRASQEIRKLLQLGAKNARVIRGGKEQRFRLKK
jgi:Cu+-exporting ATPase